MSATTENFGDDLDVDMCEDDLLAETPLVEPEPDPSWKNSFAGKIFDDIFKSGSMPLLNAYFHEYDFYPLDCDPKKLAPFEHIKIYAANMPFVVFYYSTIVLRGVSQVFLCNHPVTGFCICIGLCLSSPTLMAYALLGAIFENIGAFIVCQPVIEEMERGLFGYVYPLNAFTFV